MRNSIFAKYFLVCATVTIISLTIFGFLLAALATQYFTADKYEMLELTATKAADYTENEFNSSGQRYVLGNRVDRYFVMVAASIDSNIFLTDASGRVLYCTEKAPCAHTTFTVPKSILEETLNGGYRETGDFNGVYDVRSYSVGVPVFTRTNDVIGYIFTSMPAVKMSVFFQDLFMLLLLCEIIVLTIAFFMVYFATKRLTKPLRLMATIARKIGQGDFSEKLNVASNDEVGQLANAINNMSVSLSMLENSRRSFVANVSHELKTPMTSIAGFIDGILDGTIPPEKHSLYLNIVSDEVERLTRLVHSMLNLSRIEAGESQIHYTEFNIVDTICDSVFAFEKTIENKKLDIRGLDCEKLRIKADKDMIHQVIYNLTENAVKFSNENGYIEYTCKPENNMVYISIKNSGEGLDKDEITHIFERFYKTDKSRGLDKTGVGLGLNIVYTIIKLHGGKISVKSIKGQYTEFIVILPISNEVQQIPTNEKGLKFKNR